MVSDKWQFYFFRRGKHDWKFKYCFILLFDYSVCFALLLRFPFENVFTSPVEIRCVHRLIPLPSWKTVGLIYAFPPRVSCRPFYVFLKWTHKQTRWKWKLKRAHTHKHRPLEEHGIIPAIPGERRYVRWTSIEPSVSGHIWEVLLLTFIFSYLYGRCCCFHHFDQISSIFHRITHGRLKAMRVLSFTLLHVKMNEQYPTLTGSVDSTYREMDDSELTKSYARMGYGILFHEKIWNYIECFRVLFLPRWIHGSFSGIRKGGASWTETYESRRF